MRLTVAQALVRFLGAQHVERDGEPRRWPGGSARRRCSAGTAGS